MVGMIAVCGLGGGAGTTLLTRLIADDAIAAGDGPVLLAELPADGGLAALPGVADGHSSRSLAELPAHALAEQLADARGEHALVVVDCGRLQTPAARAVLEIASHVVWTVAADRDAGATARTLLLESDLAPPPGAAVELLAAVATQPAALAQDGHRVLRHVVAARAERLVLVPHVRALAGARPSALRSAPKRLAGTVAAISGVLRRELPP